MLKTDGEISANSPAQVVVAENLGFSYRNSDQNLVLEQLNFNLPQGHCVALTGRSGSGKSSFLNLLAGLVRCVQGSLSVCGQPFHNQTQAERTLTRRRHIGVVFQDFNLIPTLTVEENLEFVCALNDLHDQHQRIQTLLENVGLAGMSERFPHQLSGGERQRVAVARALAHSPQLILADEPTGNLDLDNARVVTQLLIESCRSAGAALVLVTHSTDLPQGLDGLYRIEDKRLVAQDAAVV